jgi:hypothetical protein
MIILSATERISGPTDQSDTTTGQTDTYSLLDTFHRLFILVVKTQPFGSWIRDWYETYSVNFKLSIPRVSIQQLYLYFPN